MLEITLQFKSVDEAIVALGKLAGPAVKGALPAPADTGVTGAAAPSGSAPAAAPQAPATSKPRKPRADAGQSRGPNSRTQEANAGGAGAQTTAAVSATVIAPALAGSAALPAAASVTEPAAPSPTPDEGDKPQPAGVVSGSGTAGQVPTIEEAEAALTAVFESKGLKIAQDVLARFGVKRLKEMLPESRGEFIAKTKAVLNGEEA